MSTNLRAQLNRVQLVALVIGLVALSCSVIGIFSQPRQFFFSYLFGYLFWLGLSLGCFLVAMIHQLTGGRWGYPTRRFFEAAYLVLPLMFVLLIPIFLGLRQLYPWAQPVEVARDPVLQQRYPYQSSWAFIARMVVFAAVWIWMGLRLRALSLAQDQEVDAAPTRKARRLSGPGIVIYSLLGTFAAVDWVMSLEHKWYSTMFPVILIIGQILSAFAFAVIMLTLFGRQEPLAAVISKTHYHHLGNLLLTFVLFWTYISFAQLLIIYSGDLPHELDWYLHRIAGGWKWVVAALAAFHFFVPFFLLLFRAVKRHIFPLTILAALLFVVRIVESYWLVMPSLHRDGLAPSWLDFVLPLGIGGVWVSAFLGRLKAAPLLPQNDPGLQFAFRYGH